MACEYCESGMRFGYGSVSIGTKPIIQVEDGPSVYVDGGNLCFEYEGCVNETPINCCPMCREKLGGDAS